MTWTNKFILVVSIFVLSYMAFGQLSAITITSVIIGSYLYLGSKTGSETKAPSTPKRTKITNPRTPPTGRREAHDISRIVKKVKGDFDPKKSSVSAETMITFLDGPRSKDMALQDFPGIGPKLAKALEKDGIPTALDLVKKFREFSREYNGDTYYTCNAFYDYLKSLKSKYPRILKGNSTPNSHTVVFGVANYADQKCSWFEYKLERIKEVDDL